MVRENNGLSEVVRRGNLVSGPAKNFEPLDGGLGWYIYNACRKYGDKVCQICWKTGKIETFASFNRRCIGLAMAMKQSGIRKGDVILSCSKNTLDSALPTIAAIYLGAISACLDPSLSARDTSHLISLVEPKMIFVCEDDVELIEDALEGNECITTEIVVIGNSEKYETLSDYVMDSEPDTDFKPDRVEDNTVALVLFSSGTTGLPKGISLSHYSTYAGSSTYFDMANYPATMMHFTTLYWISAAMTLIAQFIHGSARLLINNFDAEKAFAAIEKYKVNLIFMSSTYAYKIMEVKDINKYDTSSLETIIFGGSPLAETQLLKVKSLLPNTYCFIGYGMTEVSGFSTGFRIGDKKLADLCPKSCGRPVMGITMKVVDIETGKLLGANKSGEIRVKADSLMVGYYNQDSTAAYDSDGFIKSGDIGHFDEYCCVYVYDRIKDMFKYQSWHIVPASIESIIKEHPDVTEAVVFGIPSDQDENLPAAAITLAKGSRVTSEDIESFVGEKVIDRQKLRGGVYILEEIPKTPSQKVLRRKVQDTVLELIRQKESSF